MKKDAKEWSYTLFLSIDDPKVSKYMTMHAHMLWGPPSRKPQALRPRIAGG